MKKWLRPSVFTMLFLSAGLLFFNSWYGGNHSLSDAEISRFLSYVETLDQPSKKFIQQNDVRRFLTGDDGKPFYVVNFFQFKKPSGVSSFNQFSRRVVPLWLRYGTHPVFSSTEMLDEHSQWDRLTLVRYRSRRDWVDIVSNPDFIEALPSRLAATESNSRFIITAILIPNLFLLLLLVVSAALCITYALKKFAFRIKRRELA
jgi:hypothetical protein